MDVCILPPKYSAARSVHWPRIAFWGEGIYFIHDGYIPNINIGFFPAILWLWSVLWADWHKDTWCLNIFIYSVKYNIFIFLIMEYYLDENLWTELPSLEENLRKYEELVWKMCHSGRRIPLDRTMPRFEQNWIIFHKFGQCFTFCENWKWKYKKLKRKWGRIPRMATCRFSTKLNKFSQMWKLLGKGEISPQWKFFPKIFTNSGTEFEEEA